MDWGRETCGAERDKKKSDKLYYTALRVHISSFALCLVLVTIKKKIFFSVNVGCHSFKLLKDGAVIKLGLQVPTLNFKTVLVSYLSFDDVKVAMF